MWTLVKHAYVSPMSVDGFKTKKEAVSYIESETGYASTESLGNSIYLLNDKHIVCKQKDHATILEALQEA